MSIDIFKPIEDRFIELANPTEFRKEASFALQHINKNGQLQKATVESKVQAVLNVAQTGLSLNPVLKYAYLVPRFMGGKVEAHLEPSYQGLVKLLTDSGSVVNIYAELAYENDHFEVSLGTSPEVIHRPNLKDRGHVTHVYAVADLGSGGRKVELMTVAEVNDIRALSESYKAVQAGKLRSCVWTEHWGEMARKTIIRRIVKYLPKTNRFEKVAQAIHLDEGDYTLSDRKIDFIMSLIHTSTLEENRKEQIEREVPYMSASEAERLITELQNNQIDRIDSGHNYSQADIGGKLDQL